MKEHKTKKKKLPAVNWFIKKVTFAKKRPHFQDDDHQPTELSTCLCKEKEEEEERSSIILYYSMILKSKYILKPRALLKHSIYFLRRLILAKYAVLHVGGLPQLHHGVPLVVGDIFYTVFKGNCM